MNYNVRLIRNSKGSYDIIVNFNKSGEEFSLEFLSGSIKENKEKLKDIINKYSKKAKVSAIKIMIAGTLLASIPLASYTNVSAADKYSMSYLYTGTIAQQISYVEKTNNSLNTVSPSFFDINADGTLKVKTISKTFVDSMHASGINVVPFISNHWDRASGISFLKNAESWAAELAKLIETHNLDGINVDIENVTHLERNQYSNFVAALRAKIPANKEVSVAVAANPSGWTTGWHGSYDYGRLANHSDYLMIMAYDEHYQGSVPGPVAGINFVENTLKYALKHTTGDKIVLGLPFFGRIWSDNGNFIGTGANLTEVENLIKTYKATVTYDEIQKSPKAEFTVSSKDVVSSINGKTLSPGNYTVWYENDKSIQEKLSLVEKYNLKGAGSWALGKEQESLWVNYSSWLNNRGTNAAGENKTTTNNTTQALSAASINQVGLAKGKTSVNIRSGASAGHKIVAKVKKGTKLTVLKRTSSGWYQIQLANGKKGYASSSNISLIKTQKTKRKVVVRAKAGNNSKKLGTLAKGKKVTVLGVSKKFTKIKYNKTTAYIYSNYLKL